MFPSSPRSGVFPATLCPFHEDGLIVEEGLAAYIAELARVEGVRGVTCNGHTGEVMSLRPPERTRVTQIVRRAVDDANRETGRLVKVISGVSAEGSLEAIDHAREAKEEDLPRAKKTVAGSWATTLTGFATWWLTTQSWFVDWLRTLPQADSLQLVCSEGASAEVYTPWQIVIYMSAALVVGVVVSLVTRPVAAQKLDRFYTLSPAPIVPGEEQGDPCVLPASVMPVGRPLLIDFAGIEVPRPSRSSVVGFAIIWLCVAIIVGGFITFMH